MNISDYPSFRDLARKLIIKILEGNALTQEDVQKIKRREKITVSNLFVLERYKEGVEKGEFPEDKRINTLLMKQKTRSASGITALAILMKPFGCQGKCVFCPTEARMPKSYLSGEPGVMRAVRNDWDAKKQIETRIRALQMMGHSTDKNEVIILGGTFSNYPREYVNEFILSMYEGLNGEPSATIEEAQIKNECTENRCIGLSIETRPDCITEEEAIYIRSLGTTKIELGVQTIYEDVLETVRRGHTMEAVYQATKILKDAGFKIHYHMMPGLPGSSLTRDEKMFEILFDDARLKPDMLKIYPCIPVEHSDLKQWAEEGKYVSYTDDEIITLLARIKTLIPPYCRIMRLGRDIPAPVIIQGIKSSNIREIVHEYMKKHNMKCSCIRCREIHFNRPPDDKLIIKETTYDASEGKEHFIEYVHPTTDTIYAFVRMRIPSQYFSGQKHFMPELNGTAIIRELHTYGASLPIGSHDLATQHKGLGKKLMTESERIARDVYGIKKMAVIAGIGTREYYRKLGYKLDGMYMTKNI